MTVKSGKSALYVLLVVGLCVPAYAQSPVTAWSAAKLPLERDITTLAPELDSLQGFGDSATLTNFSLTGNPKAVQRPLVSLLKPPSGPQALALGSPSISSRFQPILQAGDDTSLRAAFNGRACTIFLQFKLVAPPEGAGRERAEGDTSLLRLGPNFALQLTGRGKTLSPKVPYLRVREATGKSSFTEAIYKANLKDELQLNRWYRLAIVWDGALGEKDRGRIFLDGSPIAVERQGNPTASPANFSIGGPLQVGGDSSGGTAPLQVAAFSVFNEALSPSTASSLDADSPLLLKGKSGFNIRPVAQYENLLRLNSPDAWSPAPQHLFVEPAVTTDPIGMLRVGLVDSDFNTPQTIRLKKPVDLDPRVKSVNFWICQPGGGKGAFTLYPVFAAADGTEIDGDDQPFFSGHRMPPNSRKSSLWHYRFTDLPSGARKFIGLKFKAEATGTKRVGDPTDAVFIKDFGLERIDYSQAKLYYVVGNYRDNFPGTRFNGAGARVLTETSGNSAQPYVLLDNLVDQAKKDRPAKLNLELEAFDSQDRRVWTSSLADVSLGSVPDFFRKVTVPITAPGTYRIRCNSSDSQTGAYYTTDWVKLVILKGAQQALVPLPQQSLLDINAAKPFGRLETNDARQVAFTFNAAALKEKKGPLTLRYTVAPYDETPPLANPKRSWNLSDTVAVTAGTPITVPYSPKRTAELVVAELWEGDKCLAHAERPIGIANWNLPAAKITNPDAIPTLSQLAGPGKIWRTITITSKDGADSYVDLERNIAEAAKLSPDLCMEVRLTRLCPMPGVYDWDALERYFDLAAKYKCRLFLYLSEKWPPEWAPVEWRSAASGEVQRNGLLYSYMVAQSLYATGTTGPQIVRQFNQQLARRFLNHPGFGGYYFENEHLNTRSYHEAFRTKFTGFLRTRYKDIAVLNKAYDGNFARFEDVPLPDKDNPALFPRQIAVQDFEDFSRFALEEHIRVNQFDAVRAEDPRRPIIVYSLGKTGPEILTYIAKNGGMMANGGVHSTISTDSYYERFNVVPGLRYRMEPHGVWNYDPTPGYLEEMIFGMLGMGGGGLNYHVFLPGQNTFNYEKSLVPGQPTGIDKLMASEPMMRELSLARKVHDPIGIMELPTQGTYEPGIWEMHAATYAFSHYSPKTAGLNVPPSYLDGSKLILIGNNTITDSQLSYLTKFVREGGRLVMEMNAGRYYTGGTPQDSPNALLTALGINPFGPAERLAGIEFEHRLFSVGQGQVLVAANAVSCDQWEAALPTMVKWAGITSRLANSSDRFMQIHVLENAGTYYVATTHRGKNQGFPTGPTQAEATVQFLQPLPAGQYAVMEILSRKSIGTFTPQQLAAGFAAGAYTELQLKVFKIARVPAG